MHQRNTESPYFQAARKTSQPKSEETPTGKQMLPPSAQKDMKSATHIIIGKTSYLVAVHFGKIPLGDILRRRILAERQQEPMNHKCS
jgi:hypothetical protein